MSESSKNRQAQFIKVVDFTDEKVNPGSRKEPFSGSAKPGLSVLSPDVSLTSLTVYLKNSSREGR